MIALTLAGCQRERGEDGRPDAGPDQSKQEAEQTSPGEQRLRPKPPRPRESLADGLREFEAAVEDEDCPRIRSLGFYGKAQISAERCEKPFLTSLEGFRPEDRDQYGTAGIVDFRTKLGSETMVFLLAADGRFRWALRAPRPQRKGTVATKPPSRRRPDGAASSAVKAFRSGRCEPLRKDGEGVLFDPSVARQQCRSATGLRKVLRRDPSARPKRLGANSTLAFYALSPRGGPYTTLVVQIKGERAAFWSFFAVPRTEK